MRNLNLLDQYRILHPLYGNLGDDKNGCFVIPGIGSTLRVIASDGLGWDHLSVSTTRRCPNWPEMKKIKELFFEDDEPAYQIFPAKKDYINCHPNCLHWWRPQNSKILIPGKELIGP